MTLKLIFKLLLVWMLVTMFISSTGLQMIVSIIIASLVISNDKDWQASHSKNNK